MLIYIILLCFLTSSPTIAKINEPIRGVNLGGWLLIEPWITPSLFEQFEKLPFEDRAIDEYTFNQRLGPIEAQIQLEKHWSTWIQEEDFKKIKEFGLSHVRIPIGWWIFGDSPSYAHNISHLDRGIALAEKFGIKVLLELHGAPGSQNGLDNSGISCKSTYEFFGGKCYTNCQEKTEWVKKSNLDLTQKILAKIAEKYKNNPTIWGLGLVNEPFWNNDIDTIKNWYDETYFLLRKIVQDWFLLMDFTFFTWPIENVWTPNFFKNWKKYNKVFIDPHLYLWPFVMEKDETEILEFACTGFDQSLLYTQNEFPLIISEWSLGVDDCAKWLVGFLNTPKKENINGGCSEKKREGFFGNFAKNQLWNFEKSGGWFFWTYKNELVDEWSYVKLVENGWIPNDARDIPQFIEDSQCKNNKVRTEL